MAGSTRRPCSPIARSEGFDVHALTFNYGQRHSAEIDAARRIAESAGVVRHHVVEIDLTPFGGSALTADIPVPKDRDLGPSSRDAQEIPVTYVPARNTIFLSYALALAEVVEASNIFIGVNALDYSGYPDAGPNTSRRSRDGESRHARRSRRTNPHHDPDAAHLASPRPRSSRSAHRSASITRRPRAAMIPDSSWRSVRPVRCVPAAAQGFSEAGLEDPISYAACLIGHATPAGRAR